MQGEVYAKSLQDLFLVKWCEHWNQNTKFLDLGEYLLLGLLYTFLVLSRAIF